MSTEHECPTTAHGCAKIRSQLSLQGIVEVCEHKISAENEIEMPCRAFAPNVLLEEADGAPILRLEQILFAFLAEAQLTPAHRQILDAAVSVPGIKSTADHHGVDVGGDDVEPHTGITQLEFLGPYEGQRVGLFAGTAARAPDTQRAVAAVIRGGQQSRQHRLRQGSENPSVAIEARDRNPAEGIEAAPFVGMGCQVVPVLVDACEAQSSQAPVYAFAHLSAHLAKAGPAQPQSWQRPLQERYALLVFHVGTAIPNVRDRTPRQLIADSMMIVVKPSYLKLLESGELSRRASSAWRHLRDCDLCARYCHVDRCETVKGAVCRTGEGAIVHSHGPHHGEEDPLRGWNGSGTIFFSWCNLRCVYCQNWDISQKGLGREVGPGDLAGMMLDLQARGCHNINFVTPSHVVAQIIAAVEIAAGEGLRLPLVYNTGGYDSQEALQLLDGIVDIYMPDMKYGDSRKAHNFSHVRDYVEINRAAVKEMHRQVGDLKLDENGIALRGMLVRHLVLPDNISGTEAVLDFLAEQISIETYVNLMDQYRPCYRADENPPLDRRVTPREFSRARARAVRAGLHRLD